MDTLPTVIASSVIRSTHQGESHGGVYLIDLDSGSYKQVLDWDKSDINWEGRGADRGLRGIEFYNNKVYLAVSDELFVYDKNFKLIESFRNHYLKHCHEIFRCDKVLFLTSTGFDSILMFDLEKKIFVKGFCLKFSGFNLYINKLIQRVESIFFKFDKHRIRMLPRPKPSFSTFDPNSVKGPEARDTLHINNVCVSNGEIFISGTGLGHLLQIKGRKVLSYSKIPFGTHNAQPFKNGVLFNCTALDKLIYFNKKKKKYEEKKLLNNNLPNDHARQAFGRGLCVLDKNIIISGSSPATISVYKLGSPNPIKTINITMDIRNAIHGLEIWPY